MKKRTVCLLAILTTLTTLMGSWLVYWYLKQKTFEKELQNVEDKYDDFDDVHIDLERDYSNLEMPYDLDTEENTEDLVDL